MAYILYYSTFCIQCQKLLQYISKSTIKNKIHFICVDMRSVDAAGNIIIHLENSQNGSADLILPPNITRVPALILIQKNNSVVFGFEEIRQAIEQSYLPAAVSINYGNNGGGTDARQPPRNNPHQIAAQQASVEPKPYVLGAAVGCGSSGFGVTSDCYSYYDMSPDELKTTGTGGTRQMHNYVSIKQPFETTIYTPQDDYVPDKVGEVSLEKLQQQRMADIGI